MKKILFVCSANRIRSRSAHLFFALRQQGRELADSSREKIVFDSCGSNPEYVEATKSKYFADAKHLTKELIDWADTIICFEHEHAKAVKKIVPEKKCTVWDLPDVFDFFDAQLISMINNIDFDYL